MLRTRTSWTGTFWNPSRDSTATAPMASTTSIPAIMRPKTVYPG